MQIAVPDYTGGSLVNLVAEIEHRLTGDSASVRLHPDLAAAIPEAETYIVVLFDGLGSHQLVHPAARDLASAHRGTIDAPFPYTTTVSLATVATGLPPSQHGILAYQLWMEEVGAVVNTIHMTTVHGEAVDLDYDSLLPQSNLWERLKAAGRDPITIQPGHFDRTPLSRTLYRGVQQDPYWSIDEAIDRTLEAAAIPGRFVYLYIPHVDFAAHVAGQSSDEYSEAMTVANGVWHDLHSALDGSATLIGTADHGHIDIAEDHKVRLPESAGRNQILYGVERALFVKGDGKSLAEGIPSEWIQRSDLPDLWGPGPFHHSFDARAPDGIIFSHDGYGLFHKHSNDRFVGYHGGNMPEERQVPMLVSDAN